MRHRLNISEVGLHELLDGQFALILKSPSASERLLMLEQQAVLVPTG